MSDKIEELLKSREMPEIREEVLSGLAVAIVSSSDELLVTMIRYAVVEASKRVAFPNVIEEDGSIILPSPEVAIDATRRVLQMLLDSTQKMEGEPDG